MGRHSLREERATAGSEKQEEKTGGDAHAAALSGSFGTVVVA